METVTLAIREWVTILSQGAMNDNPVRMYRDAGWEQLAFASRFQKLECDPRTPSACESVN